jgi:polysaccharide pyruvyl transferase WcaK-like protein
MPSDQGDPGVGPRPVREPPRVLLVGYNGANNIGSESRLLAIIEDVRAVVGPDVRITIPTLNEANLRRYVEEGDDLRIAPVPSIYFFALRRLVRQHDLILLVEGSCYMDSWTSALLWAFLWSTRCAAKAGKPSMAYAVDSGTLSPSNLKRVRKEASKTDLIVTRTQAAADRLRSWDVTAPIEVTADCTFTFEMDPADEGYLGRAWPEATSGVVGLSLVDFHIWPVVIRPWGRSVNCYRWPYYYSRSSERTQATRLLAEGFAREAERIVSEHGRDVALICMEELDEPLAEQVRGMVSCPDRVRIFSSSKLSASEMYAALRGLDALVSSRYHACVMAASRGVPFIGIGHDLRMEDLFRDLDLFESHFRHHTTEGIFDWVRERVDEMIGEPGTLRDTIERGFSSHRDRARQNREILKTFVRERGWSGST